MGLKNTVDLIQLYRPKRIRRPGVVTELGPGFPLVLNLFNVPNEILLIGLYGIVTAQKAAAAQTLRLGLLVTGGVEAFLCAASGNTTGDVVGRIYTISGLSTDTMIDAPVVDVAGINRWQSGTTGIAIGNPLILVGGVLRLTTAAAADNAGAIDWYLYYQPLADNSVVTAM